MIPVQVIMVPLFRIIMTLGLLNSRVGLGIIYGAFFSPFGVYLMTSYYSSIPGELSEAARVDGATSSADLPHDYAAAWSAGVDQRLAY